MRTAQEKALNAVQRPTAYREVLIESSGAPVALSVWDGPATGPAVLFLPGTMTHPLFYEDFLDALNRGGLTVVGLHPVGHGKSPSVRARPTVELLLRNALDALGWMRTAFPDAPVVVLGSSQGGVLALMVAARSDRVHRVVAHNILDPSLSATVGLTRLPSRFAPAYRGLRAGVRGLARMVPGLPVPIGLYLDTRRVTANRQTLSRFYTDPLGRRTYPLALVAGLLDVDATTPLGCPVVVVAASGDPLFPLPYTREVFDKIDAPAKELLVIDAAEHLIFTEELDLVLPVILAKLTE
ncbi:alpha-beta hydrolase superfamily lysophospholipase [Georgenia soli]|uniref:Alpha-beta hydrolase superfamily lysophospholipase n=1 Tax=Georgenia soli TaxID=638953 RepID=A0A2A9ES60_9MICO|nr:alpha/beta fold hydrolase [Georgenia soli]PFG41039.1 alpha-beta hydrolase superfamily lysophospholipase [Georgenia soli]